MPSLRADVTRLRSQARETPHGPAQIAVLEEATALADRSGDEELATDVRLQLSEATMFGGAPDRSIATFAWLLAALDRDPAGRRSWAIIWQYKWAISNLVDFAEIPLAQIRAAIDDFEARARRLGGGHRAALKMRAALARDIGDTAGLRDGFTAWQQSPRDNLTDCSACDRHAAVEHLLALGRSARALREAQPIIDGKSRCAEVPHETFPLLLAPLREAGEAELADQLAKRGYELVKGNPEFLVSVGRLLGDRADTLALGRAWDMFERHLPWLVEQRAGRRQLLFLLDARRFLATYAAIGGEDDAPVRVPAGFLGPEPGRPAIREVTVEVDRRLDALVPAFDRRNGTDLYAATRAQIPGRAATAAAAGRAQDPARDPS